MNAEKGEGPGLQRRYNVKGYPTLLVLDAKGTELDRFVGAMPPQLLSAQLVACTKGESFGALSKRYKANPGDVGTILAFALKQESRRDLAAADRLHAKVIAAPEATAAQRLEAESRRVFIKAMLAGFSDTTAVEAFFHKNVESDFVKDHALVVFQIALEKADVEKVVRSGDYLLGHGEDKNHRLLNAYSWFLSQQGTQLEKALEFAKKATALQPENFDYFDTLAEANSRGGHHAAAVQAAEKALAQAPAFKKDELAQRLATFKKQLAGSS